MTNPVPMITVERVTQKFGRKTPFGSSQHSVLNEISLDIPRGEIRCLVGPSGCGKTTLVNLIMGNIIPVSGKIEVMGESAPYPTTRKRIGYMPQDDALYDDITGEENLRFFGVMNGMSKHAIEKRLGTILEFTQLEDHRKKLVAAYSGGMKRRLSLGIALLHEPDLLVLDEPTVGLDPGHRIRIWEEFKRLSCEGKTLLVTTHVLEEASRCDVISMLHDGHIIAKGSPDEMLSKTNTDNLEAAFLAFQEREGVDHA